MSQADAPDWAKIALEVRTVQAGCCDCDFICAPGAGRSEVLTHGKATGHYVWIEGEPIEESK